ncbi:hypothetical protein [Parabacteroides sp. PF5-9]|uniref:OmpP1/FadL family transporter n=1 Tax=Parabacteroides sp. PF5-9 TaxID=1742404 RepID=UPI0024732978|nr:hypothetical protein [Parabacteroides sp. PF5-9]MDH6357698.1 long-subunit fatty acid transport protein [Parabacteroides sp. PF5-9]
MRKTCIAIAALALCGGVAFSQGPMDAFKYSQNDLIGTARYLGMGGAFGALGGDISAMKTNPAGLAVYRSSEVVTTLSLSTISTETNWFSNKESNNRTRVNFDNIAYVGYFPTSNDAGIVGWNVGFAYNRLKNFRRNYSMSAGAAMSSSLGDYIASRATRVGKPYYDMDGSGSYDPYGNGTDNDWLSVLGFNGGLIEPTEDKDNAYYRAFGDTDNAGWFNYAIDDARLEVSESGAIDQYDISFGMNISDVLLLGATLAITDLTYDFNSRYDEFFEFNDNDFYLDNALSTDGTGYAFNIGAIVRPVDYLRLGVAYNSPTWYKMTDYFYGESASSLTYLNNNGQEVHQTKKDNTPNGGYYEYEYRSPDKWLFSAAAIIGQSALVSVDYELVNYKNMRMYDGAGYANIDTNNDIKTTFGMGNTLRVGAEVKVTPQFAVRAGAAWASSSVKSDLKDGVRNGYDKNKNLVEVVTVGTIPHFTLDKGTSNYTIGLGYRFTPNFYSDLACVLTTYKEDAYAFSNIAGGIDGDVLSQAASLKTKNTRVALTLGYKF